MSRYLVLLHGTPPASPPPADLMEAIMALGEEAARAGVLLDTQGLAPSGSGGVRIDLTGGILSVTDGPFTEAKELIAGFWLLQVKSRDEAIEWIKRCPNPTNGESEIEIRQVFEADDFGDAFTPAARDQEDRTRVQTEANQAQAGADRAQ